MVSLSWQSMSLLMAILPLMLYQRVKIAHRNKHSQMTTTTTTLKSKERSQPKARKKMWPLSILSQSFWMMLPVLALT